MTKWDEAALLERARWAYELGRVRDAFKQVGWIFLAIGLYAWARGWTPALWLALCSGVLALVWRWRGRANSASPAGPAGGWRPLAPAAPLLLLIALWPLAAAC